MDSIVSINKFKQIKRLINYTWLLLIVIGFISLLLRPDLFTAEAIKGYLHQFGAWILLAYILLTMVRGIFLFPSTPFVFAGALLFPEQLFLVGVISMLGILGSATLLYFFAQQMGFASYLEHKYPKKLNQMKSLLNRPSGHWWVAAWAWFPLVPTDIICYAAGLVQMRYSVMILGIFIGEVILVALYLYFGSDLCSVLLG